MGEVVQIARALMGKPVYFKMPPEDRMDNNPTHTGKVVGITSSGDLYVLCSCDGEAVLWDVVALEFRVHHNAAQNYSNLRAYLAANLTDLAARYSDLIDTQGVLV